jgi:hypothetical protein
MAVVEQGPLAAPGRLLPNRSRPCRRHPTFVETVKVLQGLTAARLSAFPA